MIKEKIFFPNNIGRGLAGTVCRSANPSRRGVVFSHGLFSTREGAKITGLACRIAGAGYNLLTFDFSFSGESGGNIEDLSIFQEVRDLEAAVGFFQRRGIDRLHLMGSSMGGLVSLLYASEKPRGIASIILIAAPLDVQKLLIHGAGIADPASLPEEGKTSIDGVFIRNGFFREAMSIDAAGAAGKITAPVLVFHGARDAVVPVADAYRMMELLAGDRKLIVIADGDHQLTRPSDIDRLGDELLFHLASLQ